jgi:hypothetical protein
MQVAEYSLERADFDARPREFGAQAGDSGIHRRDLLLMVLVGAAQPIAYLAGVDHNPDNSGGHHGGRGTPGADAAARGTARAVGFSCGGPALLGHGPMQPCFQTLPDAVFGTLLRTFFGAFLLDTQSERRCDLAQLAQFGFALVAFGAQMLLERARLVGFQPVERGEREQVFDRLMVHSTRGYSCCPESTSRSFIIAPRILVFTVPRGIPSFSATSDCDKSEK